MKLHGLREGWTNPFECCVFEGGERLYALSTGMKYPGVTSIIGGEPPAFAWATWISQEASRLAALHVAGLKELQWSPVAAGDGLDYASKEVDPIELLLSGEHLRGHGQRMQSRCADRGTLTEELLKDWQDLGYITRSDVTNWLNNKLHEYKPCGNAWRCSFDDVYPYVMQLREWLDGNDVEIKALGVLVFNKSLEYATVIDMIAVICGELYLVNLKTSSEVVRHHGVQLMSERMAEFYVPTGSIEALDFTDISKPAKSAILQCTKEKCTLKELQEDSYKSMFDEFKKLRELHKMQRANTDNGFARAKTTRRAAL